MVVVLSGCFLKNVQKQPLSENQYVISDSGVYY